MFFEFSQLKFKFLIVLKQGRVLVIVSILLNALFCSNKGGEAVCQKLKPILSSS